MSDRTTTRGLPARPAAPMVGLMVALVVLLTGGPSSAHSMLEGSTPGADTVVATAPAEVVLTFSEAVTLLPDSVRVFAPDGTQVDDGQVAHAHSNAATASVGLKGGLGDGTYLVSYRIVSADSHPISGAYTFSIGHPSRAPTAAAISTEPTRGVDAALGLGRWATYAGAALGLGGALFLTWCWPAGWQRRRARRLVTSGVALLTAGTCLLLLLKGPYDAGTGLSDVLDRDLLREVLATTYGRALDARLLLIAVLILLLTYRDRIPVRAFRLGVSALLPAVGITFALCGHAAAGSLRPIAIASDTVHVTGMSLWLGGLALLLAVVLRGSSDHDAVAAPVRRFSQVATWSVTALVATGVYQSLREIRSWDVLAHTHYGHVLLVKLGIVAAALFAAAGSRAWVWQSLHPVVPVHAVTEAPPRPVADGTPPPGRLRRSVAVETAALLGVLVASALLVTSDPARPATVPRAVSTTQKVGSDSVRVSVLPDGMRSVRLRLEVRDPSGRAVDPREVDASFSQQQRSIGPLPVALAPAGTGIRTGHASLPFSGTWRLAITVRTSAIDEATAYVDVPVG